MPTATLTLPELHPGQVAAEKAGEGHQVLVMPCGRRFGKSNLLRHRGYRKGWVGGIVWIVQLSFKQGRPIWQKMVREAGQIARAHPGFCEINKSDHAIIFPKSGGEYVMRSGEDPQTLVSEGVDEVQIDEAGLQQTQVWDESLQPTLLDRGGTAVITGVPKGTQGLLYDAAERARSGSEEYALYHATTFDNPTLPAAGLRALREAHARGEIPDRIFYQEYMAQFMPADGAVFTHIIDCATAPGWDGPRPGKTIVFGVDWGKRNDYTVVSAFCLEDREQVFLERWRGIEYVQGRGRILALAQRWLPLEIVAELNSMGDPIIEDLERDGLPIRRFTTNSASKTTAVDALALAFAQQSIRILPDPVQVAELQAFEAKPLPSGATRYQAPGSGHDDTVMAMAFAWSAVDSGEGVAFAGP